MQIRVGSVSVENASTLVFGVYAFSTTSSTGGALSPGDNIITGSISAMVVRHDTTDSKVYFTRFGSTGGAVPHTGDLFVLLGGGKSVRLGQILSTSVPDYATQLSGATGTPLFTVQNSGILYSIVASEVDNITLAGPYGGTTNLEAPYVIVRDFSPYYRWALPSPQDVDLASILARSISEIDSTLYGVGSTTPTLASNWSHISGSVVRYWMDADRVVHLAGAGNNTVDSIPSTIFTLPVGYRPLFDIRMPMTYGSVSVGCIRVTTDGLVIAEDGTLSAAVYLDGITFRAEA